MHALAADLSVDDIIERVLIRSNSRYDYSRKPDAQLTSPEHLWHYRLQEENVELKKKVRELTNKYRRKDEQRQKHAQLQRDIDELKEQLTRIMSNNAELQQEINRMRLRNSEINETIRNSLDDSIQKRKSRPCSCVDHSQPHKSSPQRKENKKDILIVDSPEKSILKVSKDVAVICSIDHTNDCFNQIVKKKAHIESLKNIVFNQQKLMKSYESEIEAKTAKDLIDRKHTLASTNRLRPFERPTSQTTFKPLSSAGSIVKIRRN